MDCVQRRHPDYVGQNICDTNLDVDTHFVNTILAQGSVGGIAKDDHGAVAGRQVCDQEASCAVTESRLSTDLQLHMCEGCSIEFEHLAGKSCNSGTCLQRRHVLPC